MKLFSYATQSENKYYILFSKEKSKIFAIQQG